MDNVARPKRRRAAAARASQSYAHYAAETKALKARLEETAEKARVSATAWFFADEAAKLKGNLFRHYVDSLPRLFRSVIPAGTHIASAQEAYAFRTDPRGALDVCTVQIGGGEKTSAHWIIAKCVATSDMPIDHLFEADLAMFVTLSSADDDECAPFVLDARDAKGLEALCNVIAHLTTSGNSRLRSSMNRIAASPEENACINESTARFVHDGFFHHVASNMRDLADHLNDKQAGDQCYVSGQEVRACILAAQRPALN